MYLGCGAGFKRQLLVFVPTVVCWLWASTFDLQCCSPSLGSLLGRLCGSVSLDPPSVFGPLVVSLELSTSGILAMPIPVWTPKAPVRHLGVLLLLSPSLHEVLSAPWWLDGLPCHLAVVLRWS